MEKLVTSEVPKAKSRAIYFSSAGDPMAKKLVL